MEVTNGGEEASDTEVKGKAVVRESGLAVHDGAEGNRACIQLEDVSQKEKICIYTTQNNEGSGADVASGVGWTWWRAHGFLPC